MYADTHQPTHISPRLPVHFQGARTGAPVAGERSGQPARPPMTQHAQTAGQVCVCVCVLVLPRSLLTFVCLMSTSSHSSTSALSSWIAPLLLGKYQDEIGHQDTSCKDCPTGEFQPGSGASSECHHCVRVCVCACVRVFHVHIALDCLHLVLSALAVSKREPAPFPSYSHGCVCFPHTVSLPKLTPCHVGCEAWKTCGQGEKWISGSTTEDASCLPCGSRKQQILQLQ